MSRYRPLKHDTATCHKCGGEWEVYSIEFPPRVLVCTECGVALGYTGVDPKTLSVVYKVIKRK